MLLSYFTKQFLNFNTMNSYHNFINKVASLITEDPDFVSPVSSDHANKITKSFTDERNGMDHFGVTTREALDQYLLETISSGSIKVDTSKLHISPVRDFPPDDDFRGNRASHYNEFSGVVLIDIPIPSGVVDAAGSIQLLENGEVMQYELRDIIQELDSYSLLINHIKEDAGLDSSEPIELRIAKMAYHDGHVLIMYHAG